MFMRARGIAGKGVLALAAAGTPVFAYAYATDEGTRRSTTFWANVVPMYTAYRFVQLLNRDAGLLSDDRANRVYESLHRAFAVPTRDITYRLRGFYLKHAQMMSMQDSFVPKEFMKWVKDTQSNVPTEYTGEKAIEVVRGILLQESSLAFEDVFEDFSEQPIGVASIGQAHKARLTKRYCEQHGIKDPVVAVKFIYPNIERIFRSDIHTLKTFCEFAMPQHAPAFNEIERQFVTEFNYKLEAQNLNAVHDNIIPRFGAHVDIPVALMSSQSLLVMSFLDGVKLVDGIRSSFDKVARLSGRSLEDIERENALKMKDGTYKLKSLQQEQSDRKTLQLYMTLRNVTYNTACFLYNYSIFRFAYGKVQYDWAELPLDLAHIIQLLAKVQASAIFDDGLFNSDQHPGNIMLLKNGKIGLIDFGQVKRIDMQTRETYAKLMIAHSNRDIETVVKLHFDVGTRTKYSKPDIAYRFSAFYNDRNTPDICGDMNIATFIDYLEAQDPMKKLPDEFILLSRSSLMLRGMGNAFGLQLSVADLYKSSAETFLESLKRKGVDK